MSVEAVTLLGFVAASAVFWLQYWDLKDRHRPEPRRLLVAAFALGLGAAGVAMALFQLVALLGGPSGPGFTPASTAMFCLLVVGPVEEGAKFLAARTVVFRWSAFDEPIDGLVYGAAVALGFASVETLLYLPHLPLNEGVARTLAAPFTHSLFAAVWGLSAARGLLIARTRFARWGWQIGGLLAAMALHGLYDWVVLAYEATVIAAVIVALLWVFVIAWARRALGEVAVRRQQ